MGDVALASGHRIATLRLGPRLADIVLYGSAGGHLHGDEPDVIARAGRRGECRVVLRVDMSPTSGAGRYVVRTARIVVDGALPAPLDVDHVSTVGDLDNAIPEMVALVGERSFLAADAAAKPVSVWDLGIAPGMAGAAAGGLIPCGSGLVRPGSGSR